jgi:hypothetical protein
MFIKTGGSPRGAIGKSTTSVGTARANWYISVQIPTFHSVSANSWQKRGCRGFCRRHNHLAFSPNRVAKPLYGQKLYRAFESPSPPFNPF